MARLEDKLAEALAALREQQPNIEDIARRSRMEAAAQIALRNAVARQWDLIEAVQKEAAFGSLRGGWISFDGFGHVLDRDVLPAFLVRRVLEGGDPSTCIGEAQAFASHGRSAGHAYAAITGAAVDSIYSLGGNFELVPWEEVPDGPVRTALENPPTFGPRPNCAIRFPVPSEQVLHATALTSFTTGADPSGSDRWAKVVEQAAETVRAFCLLTARPSAVLAIWARPSEPIADEIVGGGYRSFPAQFERSLVQASLDPPTLKADEVGEKLNKLADFSQNRDVLRIAIDRTNSSFTKGLADRAIDLGIALEVLLLHEIAEKDRGELSYRMAMRGAFLLASAPSDRQALYKDLRDAYSLRSDAAHSGRVKDNERNRATLQKALEHAIGAVNKLLDRGEFPDSWESRIIFV